MRIAVGLTKPLGLEKYGLVPTFYYLKLMK